MITVMSYPDIIYWLEQSCHISGVIDAYISDP